MRITADDLVIPPEFQGLSLARPSAGRIGGVRLELIATGGAARWGRCYQQVPVRVMPSSLSSCLMMFRTCSCSVGVAYTLICRVLVSSRMINPGTVAYNTSKAGLINFTRQIAAEWGQYGITANAICPGVFPTKMARGMIDKAQAFILDRTPLRRLGSDTDLKGVAVLLASDASAYITGQAIAVDGGMTAI